jgi:hypothetical protein
MKKIIKISVNIACIFCLFVVFGCNKDFLKRPPLDQVTNETFWTSTQSLEAYMDKFYIIFPAYKGRGMGQFQADYASDNMARETPDERLAGLLSPPRAASGPHYDETWYANFDVSYNFDWIRNVNIFLQHYSAVEAPWDNVRQYVGEAYFFRAYLYFDLLKFYGDLPWINEPLTPQSEALYSARLPRNVIVDSILQDCDKAIEYLYTKGNVSASRLTQGVAQLFKSRVCLYEGTWEKYHQGTPFGVQGSDGTEYLQLAEQTARALMDTHAYGIYTSGQPGTDYQNLFNQIDLSGNPEVMLWKQYSLALDKTNYSQMAVIGWYDWIGYGGITKWLVDSYLCMDGEPISVSSEYQGDHTLKDVFANRDPRLGQTIFKPGDPVQIEAGDDTTKVFTEPTFDDFNNSRTGYRIKKGLDPHFIQPQQQKGEMSAILFRYAECLLNYAEAKAELGTISQADLDETVNVLRDRVGMTHLDLQHITHDPNWNFPNLSPIINEVRRERRVELACEGYRLDDLMRWAAAKLFIGKRPKGVYYIASNYPNLTVGKDIFVDDKGYVDIYQKVLPNGFQFKADRDYLRPLPLNELTLNTKLSQNPGW